MMWFACHTPLALATIMGGEGCPGRWQWRALIWRRGMRACRPLLLSVFSQPVPIVLMPLTVARHSPVLSRPRADYLHRVHLQMSPQKGRRGERTIHRQHARQKGAVEIADPRARAVCGLMSLFN